MTGFICTQAAAATAGKERNSHKFEQEDVVVFD